MEEVEEEKGVEEEEEVGEIIKITLIMKMMKIMKRVQATIIHHLIVIIQEEGREVEEEIKE